MHPTHHPAVDVDGCTPAVVLRDAAGYLQRHGWIQGLMFEDPVLPSPPACVIGAIKMAIGGDPFAELHGDHLNAYTSTLHLFAGYVDTVYYAWGIGDDGEQANPLDVIGDWNDHDERTVEQVITALQSCADEWDATHGGTR